MAAAVCVSLVVAVLHDDQPPTKLTAPTPEPRIQDGSAPDVTESAGPDASTQVARPAGEPPDDAVTWSRAIGPGENLDILLAEAGLDAPMRAEVSRVVGSEYDLRRLQPGYRLSLKIARNGTPRSAVLEVENGLRVHAAFGPNPSARTIPPELTTVVRAGEAEITTNIYAALEDAGIPTRFATDLELILDGTLHLRREVTGGERLRIVWRENLLDDRLIGEPTIDFAEVDLGHEVYEVLWPDDDSRRSLIYKDDRLLRAFHQPVRGARLSSAYGRREHPVHGGVRMHNGVDFAAEFGSPVHATAPGNIVFFGRRSGYGLMVEIEHPQNVRTIYAHLSATSEALEVGQGIAMGDVIGSVGSTGTSTAPHLHYELVVEGTPVPPLTDERLLLPEGGSPGSAAIRVLLDEARGKLADGLAWDGQGISQPEG